MFVVSLSCGCFGNELIDPCKNAQQIIPKTEDAAHSTVKYNNTDLPFETRAVNQGQHSDVRNLTESIGNLRVLGDFA